MKRGEKLDLKGAESEADLTDSSRYLALYAPDIYRVYGKRADEYRSNLTYEVSVRIRML